MPWSFSPYRLTLDVLRPYTLFFLLAGLGLANLWRKRRESPGRLLLATIPFGALTLISLPAASHVALGTLEWRYFPPERRPRDAGAIVVLSGAVLRGDGVRTHDELGDSSLYRCLHAADVYHDGPPLPVVVTGGKGDPHQPGLTCAELMRDFLDKVGVASSDVVVEGAARSTYENALNSRKLLEQRGIRKIILVTEATHMLRGVSCFRRQGLEVIPSACHYRATKFEPSVSAFLPNPNAARDVLSVAHEWLGMAWYGMLGRI